VGALVRRKISGGMFGAMLGRRLGCVAKGGQCPLVGCECLSNMNSNLLFLNIYEGQADKVSRDAL
jgi:hypothetical protein